MDKTIDNYLLNGDKFTPELHIYLRGLNLSKIKKLIVFNAFIEIVR